MGCFSGNSGTVTTTKDGDNVVVFTPATDGYPFEDTGGNAWSGFEWWVEEFHVGSSSITVGRTANLAQRQPSFVTDVTSTQSYSSGTSRLDVDFTIDLDLMGANVTAILFGVAATSGTDATEYTGQFCFDNTLFSFLDSDTIWLGTPASIVASGGLLTSWDDLATSPADMNTTDLSGSPTQPTVDAADSDFGTSIVLNSLNDHRATATATKFNIGGASSDVYIWFVFKSTYTAGDGVFFWYAQQTGVDGGTAYTAMHHDIFQSGELTFQIGGVGASATAQSTTALDDGVPHLIEIEYDGSANTVKMWVDGTLEDTTASVADLDGFLGTNKSLHIGRFSSTGGDPEATNGEMAVLKINDAIPSAARITAVRAYCRDNLGVTGLP
jgi:hypothetical protein